MDESYYILSEISRLNLLELKKNLKNNNLIIFEKLFFAPLSLNSCWVKVNIPWEIPNLIVKELNEIIFFHYLGCFPAEYFPRAIFWDFFEGVVY